MCRMYSTYSTLHVQEGTVFSRATDQQYEIEIVKLFEDSSKLHGHTNEHVQSHGVLPNQSLLKLGLLAM